MTSFPIAELGSTLELAGAMIGATLVVALAWQAHHLTRRERCASLAPNEAASHLLRSVESKQIHVLCNLSASVAHEINSPIGSLAAQADVSQRAIALVREAVQRDAASPLDDRKLRRALAALDKTASITRGVARRVSEVVGSLQSLSMVDRAPLGLVDLHRGLDSAIQLLSHRLSGSVSLEKDYGEIPLVRCDGSRIYQAFINVIGNALEAMPQGGRITVQTRSSDEAVVIRITDTGEGIAADHLPRVFEPGFTTRDQRSNSSGLGLALTARALEAHGGSVIVNSERSRGTTVTIRLPVARG